MKLRILALAVSAAILSTSVFADSQCNGNQNCNDIDDHSNTANGGTGVGVGIGVGNAKIERGAVDIDNKNLNLQGQKQKQQQQQQQQQKASARSSSESWSNSNSSVDDSGNASINWQNPRNTASAYSPAMVASSETCVQSQSAGAQGPAFGISLGFSHSNEGCEMRRNAGMLFALGQKAAAVELLCLDQDIREAMKAAGSPCRSDMQSVPVAQGDEPFAKVAAAAKEQAMAPIED